MAANGTVDLDGVTMEDGAFTEESVSNTEDTVNNNTEDTVYEKVELPPINVVGIFATGLLDNILVSTEATQAATAAAIAALGTIPPEWIGHGSPLRAGSIGTMTALTTVPLSVPITAEQQTALQNFHMVSLSLEGMKSYVVWEHGASMCLVIKELKMMNAKNLRPFYLKSVK